MSRRFGIGIGRRSAGLLLALVAELLLIVALLTLGSSITRDEKGEAVTTVRFQAVANQKDVPETPEAPKPDDPRPDIRPAEQQARPSDTITPVTPPRPEAAAPQPIIRLSPKDMAVVDIATLPRRPQAPPAANRPMMGPADTGSPSPDTARVSGSGPNGEPLYAAAWYRRPYDDELSGFLSTASGPGWGLIACRTAPDYRVEDCVKVDEYPTGSNIARAVLAAAWQFKVRPPRIGGQPRIGEWVRIRIDYGIESRSR